MSPGGSVSDTRAQQEDGAKVALQEAFHLCDEDRDGFLSEQEMQRLVMALGLLQDANWTQMWLKICEQVQADPSRGVDINGVAWHLGQADRRLLYSAVQKLRDGFRLTARSSPARDFRQGVREMDPRPSPPPRAPPRPDDAPEDDTPWLPSPGTAAKPRLDPLERLQELQEQINKLQDGLQKVEAELNMAEITPAQARDVLAQLEARLDQVQCKGIDSVSMEGLVVERQEEARFLRKALTRQAESLQDRFDTAFAAIKRQAGSTRKSL